MDFWIGCLIVIGIVIIGSVCYACCVVSGDSQKQSEEEFMKYLEEMERIKNG